jgi:hypothetical protein
MNRIVKIFATGFLSVWALTASAQNGEGDTKESLFNPLNYAVITQTSAAGIGRYGLGDDGIVYRIEKTLLGVSLSVLRRCRQRPYREKTGCEYLDDSIHTTLFYMMIFSIL